MSRECNLSLLLKESRQILVFLDYSRLQVAETMPSTTVNKGWLLYVPKVWNVPAVVLIMKQITTSIFEVHT
jgi:hypothetical protein